MEYSYAQRSYRYYKALHKRQTTGGVPLPNRENFGILFLARGGACLVHFYALLNS